MQKKQLKDQLKMGKMGLIDAKEYRQLLKHQTAHLLLDIRKYDDYQVYHLKNAVHSEWEAAADLIAEDRLPKDQPIIVICYNGQSSMQVATVLNINGYEAYSLLDGYESDLK